MKNECNIIRDLLPLYAENMVSSDTAAYVGEHLKDCAACRKEYEKAAEPQPIHEIAEAAPLRKLKYMIKVKRIQTIILTALFVAALFVSAYAVLDAPVYFPYSEGIVTVEQLGEQGMLLAFDEEVTAFDYTVYDDPESGDFYYCDIQAWTSLWDKWFSRGKTALSSAVITKSAKPVVAVYIPNDGTENVCVARYDPNAEKRVETKVDCGRAIALPRLSLGYYLILAAAALSALTVAWLLTGKRAGVRVWIERIGLYPIAYIVSHCIVSGMNWASYSLPRDFSLILFISVLLYGGLLLWYNIWRLKRELSEHEMGRT